MEKTLQLNVEPIPKSVRAKQTIAAVLIMICVIVSCVPFLSSIIPTLLGIEYYVDGTFQVSLGHRLYDLIIFYGLEIISFIVLLTISSNKVTKIATLLFVVAVVIGYLQIGLVLRVVVNLLIVYALSLIITNNEDVINNKSKVWVSFYCLYPVMGIMGYITYYIFKLHQIEWTSNLDWSIPYDALNELPNIGMMVWNIIWGIFVIISMFHFVRCGAFNGRSASEVQPQENYSPLNKYMLGAIVGCVVGVVFLAIIYGNVDAINELASNF